MIKFTSTGIRVECGCPSMAKDTDGVVRWRLCNCGVKDVKEYITHGV